MRFPPPAGGKFFLQSCPLSRESAVRRAALSPSIYIRADAAILLTLCQKCVDTGSRECYTYYADTTSEHIGKQGVNSK